MHQLAHRRFFSAAPFISTDLYISLEMKRYIENTETPGLYGFYTAGEATS